MQYTNKLNLPEPIFDAVRNDPYHSGGADYSVTTLLKPPQMVELERRHKEQIVEDVSDRIFALLGQLMHLLLERGALTGPVPLDLFVSCGSALAAEGKLTFENLFRAILRKLRPDLFLEERLFMTILGKRISGQMDLVEGSAITYDGKLLRDYKLTTVFKVKDGLDEEFEKQQNCYAALLRTNGYNVECSDIVAILRDWSKMRIAREDERYPKQQIILQPVPLWTHEKAIAFLEDRVREHEKAKKELPECSEEERWAKETVYAVLKKGAKRAVNGGLKKTYEEALAMATEIGAGAEVQFRPGENTRCEYYCRVKAFCPQYRKLKGLERLVPPKEEEKADEKRDSE